MDTKTMAQGGRRDWSVVLLLAALVVSIVLEGFEWPYHAVTILLLPLICAALFFGFKMNRKVSIIFMAAVPAICFYALEGYSHLALTDMTAADSAFEFMPVLSCFYHSVVYFWKSSVALSVLALAMMLIGLINYYVVAFRGTPVVPWDLLSVSTALSVTVNYVFSAGWPCCDDYMYFCSDSGACFKNRCQNQMVCQAQYCNHCLVCLLLFLCDIFADADGCQCLCDG